MIRTAMPADGDDVLRAALLYAARGWRVVPIRPGEKRPAFDEWQRWGTTDVVLIRDVWSRWPHHGVGIVTGRESGVFVLDVDINPAKGKHGDDSLADLEATYGALPATMECITGSGGRHLYFRYPAGLEIGNSAGRLGPGLDVRAEGGQVLAPPTRHPDGGLYVWEALSDPADGVVPVDAPAWLLNLLTTPASTAPRADRVPYVGVPRPGDKFAASVTWPDLLRSDGATFLDTRSDRRSGTQYEIWARPGVDHGSATLYYAGSDVLKVFTSNWAGLVEGETYTRFGYFVATRYGGDFGRAAGDLAARYSVEEVEAWVLTAQGPAAAATDDPGASDGLPVPIDWGQFWLLDNSAPEWLVEPFLPAGRHVVLYAPAKEGKSLLALEVAAGAATGAAVLGQAPQAPVEVVYLDFEMTEDDLHERLTDMGYDEASDLAHLHYYSLPTLPMLDTKAGGDVVEAIVRKHGARLVVIDTMARVVAGEENSADTYRAFDRYTSLRMKAQHVAVLRLDHAGKDTAKGQRGSSEKVGYADVVWSMVIPQGSTRGTLRVTHQRIGWVPDVVTFERVKEPTLRHMLDVDPRLPAGTEAGVRELDGLGVPVDVSVREAIAVLKRAAMGRKREVVTAAVKARKMAGNAAGNADFGNVAGNAPDEGEINPSDQGGTQRGTQGNANRAPAGEHVPPNRGARVTRVPTDDDLDPLFWLPKGNDELSD